jgi:glucose dehydrogenase
MGAQSAPTTLLSTPAAIALAGCHQKERAMASPPVDSRPANGRSAAAGKSDLRNLLWMIAIGVGCVTAATAAVMATARPAQPYPWQFPGAHTLLEAPQDGSNWMLPARTYVGNRHRPLTQIDKSNVHTLHRAWQTDIADDGEQEAAPIVW